MTKITAEMGTSEYYAYTTSCRTKSLRAYTAGKSYQLPRPYNRIVAGVLEAELLREARFALANAGIWHMRIEASGKIIGNRLIPSAMTGLGDIIALDGNGRLVAVEIKRPGGRLSSVQAAVLRSIIEAGGRSVVAVTPAKIVEWIKSSGGVVGLVAEVPVI